MKCIRCGNEFEGKFCTQCGARAAERGAPAPNRGTMPQMGSAPRMGNMPQMGNAPQMGNVPQMGNMPQMGNAPQMRQISQTKSVALLVANVLASLYICGHLIMIMISIAKFGFESYVNSVAASFKLLAIFGGDSIFASLGFLIWVGYFVHVILFAIGSVLGWMSYVQGRHESAKGAAILYLIGTIAFPFYVLFGLPITIVGFVASGNQKNIMMQGRF